MDRSIAVAGLSVLSLLTLLAVDARAQATGAARVVRVQPESIQGRISTDSGAAIPGAKIIATRAPDRVFQSAISDSDGNYKIQFAEGTGDYLLHVSAAGWNSARRRVLRTGTESVIHVDFQLHSSVQQLEPVRVEATKPKPSRETEQSDAVGAAQTIAAGVRGAVSATFAGDLVAIASTIPAVTALPGGFSVLGIGADQNRTTLNGLSFGGTEIPRDARVQTRVATSSYDPARGWFGGAEQAVEVSPGDLFSSRRSHVTIDAPFLQYGDAASSAFGGRFSNINLNVGGDGSMNADTYSYNYGVSLDRRASDITAIEGASTTTLRQTGVSPDSVARFLTILSAAGIPFRSNASSAVTQKASFIGRLDHQPYDWKTFSEAKTTWGMLGFAELLKSDGIDVFPNGTFDHGGSANQAAGSVQGFYSSFSKSDQLTTVHSALSLSRNNTTPTLRLPEGRVFVSSALDGGGIAATTLAFGGNSSLSADRRDWTWENNVVTQFFLHGLNRHLLTFTADGRLDGFVHDHADNPLGTFWFNSLSDVANRQPSSFARMLDSQRSSGAVWNGFIAVADRWRQSQTLQFMFGARLEGNRFTDSPQANAQIENVFGTSTASVPNSLHISPRAGFTWLRKGTRWGHTMSALGDFYTAPSYLRGGIGEFRNFLSPTLLEGALSNRGLAGAPRSLRCDGTAAPAPAWESFKADAASIPVACVAGSTPVFADETSSVELFDPGFTAPRSWRANLGYSWSVGKVAYTLEGIASLNLDQSGVTDLNFDDRARFTLADEGRPVFVSPSSIVEQSGIVSPVEARRTALFGRVIQHRSNLRSFSRQLTLTVTPDFGVSNVHASASYTLSGTRAVGSGFDGSTFLSPTIRDHHRANLDARHQILFQAGAYRKRLFFTLFGRLQSGFPFTPIIDGDVNGDGLVNDRAFVFDPSMTADPVLASATRSLITSAPSSVRNCLRSQLGRAAASNSCVGPWTATLNAQVTTSRMIPHLNRGGDFSLSIANPLGGIDYLLHGANKLHGWGTQAAPDPVLYYVRGFNAASQRFNYQVNPRFGDTRGSVGGNYSPFRITLEVSIDIGTSMMQQQVSRWIEPGRNGRPGPKLSADELKKRYQRSVPDPYAKILEETDSLLLSRDQVDSLRVTQTRYLAAVDTIWTGLAQHLASLGDRFNAADALRRQEAATDEAWELTRLDVKKSLPGVLSRVQLQLLPFPAGMLYRSTEKVHIRMFLSG